MADMRHYVNLRGLSDSEIIERTAEFIDAEQSQSLTDFELAMTEAGTNRATVEKALTQYRA